MRILYIKLTNGYRDDFTYQENVLPAKFVKLGYETHIFVSTRSRDTKGDKIIIEPMVYINKQNVTVHVLPFDRKLGKLGRKLDIFDTLYDEMCSLQPDFIFVHGIQFLSVLDISRYKKLHPKTVVVADNHADYNIMPLDTVKHKILQKYYYKFLAQRISPYIEKFYGVSPLRARYLYEVYGIPENKIGVITQGGDEEIVNSIDYETVRKEVRNAVGIKENKILVVSGAGNIDRKKRIYELMEAISNNSEVELIVFGTFSNDEKIKCDELLKKCSNIHYIGRIPGIDSYRYFMAADIAVFPGQHSVFWDQVVACGIPIAIKRIPGMDYFDVNGNCLYMNSGTTKEIYEMLLSLEDRKYLRQLKQNAQGEAKKKFSYINIAKNIVRENMR